jgi:uncharacterized protein YdbL (DUF1318 family)
MKKLSLVLVAVLSILFITLPAFALELADAKSQGLVGEVSSGYLGAVAPNAAGEVKALVERINDLRRKEYQKIAQKNGTPLAVVERIGGKKAVELTPAGQFVMIDGKSWRKVQ